MIGNGVRNATFVLEVADIYPRLSNFLKVRLETDPFRTKQISIDLLCSVIRNAIEPDRTESLLQLVRNTPTLNREYRGELLWILSELQELIIDQIPVNSSMSVHSINELIDDWDLVQVSYTGPLKRVRDDGFEVYIEQLRRDGEHIPLDIDKYLRQYRATYPKTSLAVDLG